MKRWSKPGLFNLDPRPNVCYCGAKLKGDHDPLCPFPAAETSSVSSSRLWIIERAKLIHQANEAELEIDWSQAPTIPELIRWEQGGFSKAVDGCIVGIGKDCHHGSPCWLKALGLLRDE